MPRHLHFTKFLIASVALHALMIVAALYLIKPAPTPLPFTPVGIVNLPQQEARQLPPLQRPQPVTPAPVRPTPAPPTPPAPPAPPAPPVPQRIVPEKRLPPSAVPMPKKFGESDELKLPKTSPRSGVPEGAEEGMETGKTGMVQEHREGIGKAGPSSGRKETGPLPFVTQNEIDQLARKGMPQKPPGDNSVTLDTDEFKLMSYNRWLKIKIESTLKYPELAAVSGYQGTLYIKFDINKDGSLGGLDILQSSGFKILDDEALRAIRASAPFQPLPEDWKMDRYSIRAAVIFYLGAGYIR